MKQIQKEDKFFVLKQADIEEFFEQFYKPCNCRSAGECTHQLFMTPEGERLQKAFDKIIKGIGDMREANGKPRSNKYVVCNQDEPYAELVWQVILMGERAKDPGKHVHKRRPEF